MTEVEERAGHAKPGRITRAVRKARYVVGSLLVTVGLVASGGMAAHATGTSDVNTLVQGGFSSVTDLLTGVIVPALFGLTVLIIAVVVGIKWLRKGAKQG